MARYAASHLLWIIFAGTHECKVTATTCARALAQGIRAIEDGVKPLRSATNLVACARIATKAEARAFVERRREAGDEVLRGSLLDLQAAGALEVVA